MQMSSVVFSHILYPSERICRKTLSSLVFAKNRTKDQFTDPIQVKAFGTAVDRGAGFGRMQQKLKTDATSESVNAMMWRTNFH